MLGTTEILIIGFVLILLFGSGKVVDWAKSLGEARKEFAKASKEETKE